MKADASKCLMELRSSLEHLKGYIGRFLLDKRPMDVPPAEWVSWLEWNLDDIHHAIDHVIVDHCIDKDEKCDSCGYQKMVQVWRCDCCREERETT